MNGEHLNQEGRLNQRELLLMWTRSNDHHLLLYGEDGQSGFVRTTQDFIATQKGSWATIKILGSVIVALLLAIGTMVAVMTFARGH